MKFDVLTVEVRHELYKAMLAEIDAPEKQDFFGQSSCTYGLCFLLCTIIGNPLDLWYLHELWRYKPKDSHGMYWFEPGEWKERREILVQCIEETHRALTIQS